MPKVLFNSVLRVSLSYTKTDVRSKVLDQPFTLDTQRVYEFHLGVQNFDLY